MWFSALYTLLFIYNFHFSFAQDTIQEKIWSSVVYTIYGDSTPQALPYSQTLTPWGAQQLVGVGSAFRSRYLGNDRQPENPGTRIGGISPVTLVHDELTILSTADQYVSASAQAFMQGFYPPMPNSSNNTTTRDLANIVNGTSVDFPLNGYQYPEIVTPSFQDPNSVYVAGQVNCQTYGAALSQWLASNEFRSIDSESAPFYSDIYSRALQGVFARENANFLHAFAIYDYLNYQHIHNSTSQSIISLNDLNHARYLADKWVFAANGNLEIRGRIGGEEDKILAVAGRTLAKYVVEAFETNYLTNGAENKLSLLFGSFEPMVAFASLSKLASDRHTNFFGLPNQGASMVFELFSMASNVSSNEYPGLTDLMVRFFLRNGTNASDSSTPLVSYPLFGRGPGQPGMPFREFKNEMVDIMMAVPVWCHSCGGDSSTFCAAYAPDFRAYPGFGSRSLKPAVAGAIGAVVGLIVAGLIVAIACWACGLRLCRNVTRRRSDLGGFKGGDKLASDPDLAGGSRSKAEPPTVGVSVKVGDGVDSDTAARGHERVGSWEMRSKIVSTEHGIDTDNRANPNGNTQARLSLEDDDLTVNPIAEPVKAYEHV
ncbi:hypothetical protein AJ78_03466 [Emergomyces pasteurianus Ep9510]|uniref:Histidine acid phosphatase n=1 Tax=Emergomyces pasteurianus Ep9510 TaxID=1447872 RepID=A0A1J9QJL2_9EURO|nr:hypothetical protein AJ78_03466 [Emergomyces pasteurianus Ep9510]